MLFLKRSVVITASFVLMFENPLSKSFITSHCKVVCQTKTHGQTYKTPILHKKKDLKTSVHSIGQPFSLALSVVQGDQESSRKEGETAPCSIRDHLGDLQWASWEEGKRKHSTWSKQYCFAYTTLSLQNIINISKPNLNAQHHQPIRDISQWIANTDTSFSSADLEED